MWVFLRLADAKAEWSALICECIEEIFVSGPAGHSL